jgi:arylsulfatase A
MNVSRRSFLQLPFAAAAGAAGRPPNIVLIMADDLGAAELGCYGNHQIRTPNLDAMARQGVRFETCYATPLCSPSRVELMTGRYGFRTGFTNFIGRTTTRKERFSADEPTFADMLNAHGYATGLAGKWQLGLLSRHPTMIHDSGFDEYYSWAWTRGGLPDDANFNGSPRQRYWHPAIVSNGKHVPTTAEQYGEDLYSDWLIGFMKRNAGRPFIAYYPMCLVHEPWDPTPDVKNPGRKTDGGLRNNVEYMDHIVGKVLRSLDEMELAGNTIVFFTGDNGTGKNGKGTVTEKGVRVPMIVRGPGIRNGVVSRDLVDFSDVLPTLAELTRAPLPQGVAIDGQSFAAELQGRPGKRRDWIFSYLGYERMLRDKRWLLEGDGTFYDCGESRDGASYRDVTAHSSPEVVAARQRFETILAKLPAPPREPPGVANPLQEFTGLGPRGRQ